MKMTKILSIMIIIFAGATQFIGCSNSDGGDMNQTSVSWQTLPENASQPVDVFFVYPTTYFYKNSSPEYSATWNQTIEQAKADTKIPTHVESKASVFYRAGTNLYVPYYRQGAGVDLLDALLWENNASKVDAATEALELAYSDVEKAFDLYIDKYNKDSNRKPRPFILAGHSQGSNLLLMLLERRFSDSVLKEQLVAAYILGWSITSEDMSNYPALSQLGICSSYEQTGCIITYNTQETQGDFSQPFGSDKPVGIVKKNAFSVNPLTWVATNPNESELTSAPNTENIGALFYEFQSPLYPQLGLPALGPDTNQTEVTWDTNRIGGMDVSSRIISHYTGAQNRNGALVIKPDSLPAPGNYGNLNFPYNLKPGWYHNYDYNFFFFNIEQNVIDRIRSYNSNH